MIRLLKKVISEKLIFGSSADLKNTFYRKKKKKHLGKIPICCVELTVLQGILVGLSLFFCALAVK